MAQSKYTVVQQLCIHMSSKQVTTSQVLNYH